MKVIDLDKEFMLIDGCIAIREILDYIGSDYTEHDYGCLFVRYDKDGSDIREVYGIENNVPYLGLLTDKLFSKEITS